MKRPGLFARALKALSQIVFPQTTWWGTYLPRSSFDYQREVGDGLSSSVVAATVGWIARRFVEAPMVVIKDEETEHEHALLDLLRRPNPYYSGRAMMMAVAGSYSTDGNGYLVKVRNGQAKPTQLWYIPHWLIEPHWPVDGSVFIDHYSYKPLGTQIKLDPEDVIHFRNGLDPRNTRKGLAPLKSLYREIFTDDEAANFSASLLRNFGVPGLVISPGDDAQATEGDKDAVKQFFRERFGRDNRGEPLVMSSKTEIKQLSFSPEALDLGRLREIPEERVTAVLGVPAAVVGFGTGLQQTKVGATMAELREAAYEDCIIPMQNTIAEELDVQLMPEFETDRKVHVGFDLSDVRVLQEDENKHAERVRTLVAGGILTIGEGRRELGYEVKPEHEVYQMSIATMLIPAGRRLETPASASAGDNGNGDGKARLVSEFKLFLPAGLKGEEWQARLTQALVADWVRLSAIWEKELAREFRRLGRTAREAWEKLVEDRGVETLGIRAETKTDLDDVYAELVAVALHADRYAEYSPHFLRVATSTYATIENVLGLGISFSDAAEMHIIAAGGTRRGLVDLIQQSKDAMLDALAIAREAGEGPYEAAARIEEMVGGGRWHDPQTRARVIGRTETKYAQNVSSLEAYKSGGIAQVQIIDGQLPTSCEDCIARNGRIISIDEAYALDEHPNGTLSFAPVVGG